MANPLDRQPSDENGDIQRIQDELSARIGEEEGLQSLQDELASKKEQDGDIESVDHLLLSKTERWSGPLPPPDLLGQYELIYAGLADRIVSMAEREQQHQIQMQQAEQVIVRKLVSSDIIHTYLGTILGFVFAMAFLVVGGWLIANGHWKSGLPIGLVTPAVLFSMFAYRFSRAFRNPPAGLEDNEENGIGSDTGTRTEDT